VTIVPPGWTSTTLGDVAGLVRNGLFRTRPSDEPVGVAILRISAVRHDGLDLTARKYVSGLSHDETIKYSVQQDDLLITRYNGSRRLVGLSALVPTHEGPLLHPDKLIRVGLDKTRANPHFVNYQMASPRLRAFLEPRIRTTAGQSGISGADVKSMPLWLPVLAEQRRIVELLDGHLSRLDAGSHLLFMAERRTRSFVRAVLENVVPGTPVPGWRDSTVGMAGRLQLGRARHPDWHDGPEVRPYLRVANVFEDRIDISSVMSMDFSGVFEKYRLVDGDVLLNEGQSPHLLGRPAIYRGTPAGAAFTNSLIRFQAGVDVLPEWALLVFRRHMHSGRFRRESRITTNIAHLSMTRLKQVEFPIPPLDEQRRRVRMARELLAGVEYMEHESQRARAKGEGLRRALLDAAFSGWLTGRASDLDRVEELAEASA